MLDRVGQQFGNYRLMRLLGHGGFAEVYLGHHIYLNTQAAVKVLSTRVAANDMENFLTEARYLSRLLHPNIIRVLEFGIENNTPFLVMDYAPNGTLRQRHPAGEQVPISIVVSYVKQVAEALQYAHDQKLIHRDIKPENMLLGRNAEVLLTDFGLALIVQSTGSMDFQRMMGTLAYMAPEQIQGKPRPASDQYALGVVVYEWLTGEPPFQGTLEETFSQHLFAVPPSLREKVPTLPLAVEQVMLKVLAKEPQQRFENIRTFALSLEDASQGISLHTSSTESMEPIEPIEPIEFMELTETPAQAEQVLEVVKVRFQNLPEQLSPLIGREKEVEEARFLLMRPEVRLVTFTGIGGVGKTRLSIQVATELSDAFTDGVCFVPLAPISDPNLVLPAIAQTLNIGQRGARPLLERVKGFLRDKYLLLLLDNFEQVVDAAPVLTELMMACPKLKLLVTSRAVLHIRGEHEFPVPPLALPDLKHLPSTDDFSHYGSVALFSQRAAALKPSFQITHTNAPIIAEICVRLDGLPLAIELAAARIKLLPPQSLLRRLEHRLQILTSSARDVPARQQTLRNAIAWSYDLLNFEEQLLFRRFSVFVGGCTLEAVEALYTALGDDATPVLDRVTSLIDKSLLQQIDLGDDESRLFMLETIREYSLESLAAYGETETVQGAHAEYYRAFVEQAGNSQEPAWLKQLEREHDNLRAALRWFVEHGEAGDKESQEKAIRLSGALWWFWSVRGHVSEGGRWLERALTNSEGITPTVRAIALDRAGMLAYAQENNKRAEELFSMSLAIFRELSDSQGMAISLYRMGLAAWARSDHATAISLADEALTLFTQIGDKEGCADTYLLLAYAAYAQGEYARAQSLTEQSLALFREISDKWGTAYSLIHLARIISAQGEYDKAHTLLEESLALSKELDYRGGIASCLEGLAGVAAARKQLVWAARLWGAAEVLRETVGIPLQPVERPNYERAVGDVRTALGEEAFARAFAEGRTLTPEQAIASGKPAIEYRLT